MANKAEYVLELLRRVYIYQVNGKSIFIDCFLINPHNFVRESSFNKELEILKIYSGSLSPLIDYKMPF